MVDLTHAVRIVGKGDNSIDFMLWCMNRLRNAMLMVTGLLKLIICAPSSTQEATRKRYSWNVKNADALEMHIALHMNKRHSGVATGGARTGTETPICSHCVFRFA